MQGSSALPIGTILPFIGNLNKIPNGWYLCNGQNGTPDLRNQFLQGEGINGVKSYISAGLPNITGTFGLEIGDNNHYRNLSGAFVCIGDVFGKNAKPDGTSDELIQFNAALSNPVYGNSPTVQPPAYTVYFIIRLK